MTDYTKISIERISRMLSAIATTINGIDASAPETLEALIAAYAMVTASHDDPKFRATAVKQLQRAADGMLEGVNRAAESRIERERQEARIQ